jgi:hypothetical protein
MERKLDASLRERVSLRGREEEAPNNLSRE